MSQRPGNVRVVLQPRRQPMEGTGKWKLVSGLIKLVRLGNESHRTSPDHGSRSVGSWCGSKISELFESHHNPLFALLSSHKASTNLLGVRRFSAVLHMSRRPLSTSNAASCNQIIRPGAQVIHSLGVLPSPGPKVQGSRVPGFQSYRLTVHDPLCSLGLAPEAPTPGGGPATPRACGRQDRHS